MIPVAELLTTAAAFWGAAAGPTALAERCPDGLRYGVRPLASMVNSHDSLMKAEATQGSCTVWLRAGWRQSMTDRLACRLVLHEVGHAAFGLTHEAGGIMREDVDRVAPPAACMRYSNR